MKKERRKKQKIDRKYLKELEIYGAGLSDVRPLDQPGRFYLCFLRAILIFLAVYGMLAAIVTSFALPFSKPVMVLGIMVLAFISAFLYYNKITFYVGYLVVFASFVFFSIYMYLYVNSGYQAFLNEVYNKYSDYFRLSTVREADEIITDRYLTVTCAMLFMGWFFCILLNITISGYMSLALTFLVTFLPLQVAFYIDIIPPLHYLVMLIAVYITVAVLGRSGHYTLPYRHDREQHFEHRRRRKRQQYTYLASSGGMLTITVYSLIISALFMVVASSVFARDFDGRFVSNRVKDRTDEYVKTVMQGGLASLLNRYSATGGLAKGQLGGIGSVIPDYEPDLFVQFATDGSDSVYLKAYTGVFYNDVYRRFQPYSDPDSVKQRMLSEEDLKLADDSAPYVNTGSSEIRRMHIENADADTEYDYSPYYTAYTTSVRSYDKKSYTESGEARFDETYPDSFDLIKNAERFEDEERVLRKISVPELYTSEEDHYDVLYMPFSSNAELYPNPSIPEEYEELVSDVYLQVPEGLYEALDSFIAEADLASIRDPLDVAYALKEYFIDNFSYTMSPGMTPWGRDMIEYFLLEQRRGFCAHYAASSTLIFRRLGIPARYIEGYVITPSDIADSKALSSDLSSWIYGEYNEGEAGVVEVEVTDGSAHAWTEIYLNGYGWIPFETTPPSDESLYDGRLSFLSRFFDLLQQTRRNGGETDSGITPDIATPNARSLSKTVSSLSFILRPIGITLGLMLLVILLRRPALALYLLIRQSFYAAGGHYNEALLVEYRKLINLLKKKKLLTADNPLPRDIEAVIQKAASSDTAPDTSSLSGLTGTVNFCAYSGRELDAVRYASALALIRSIRKSI
ncbi:MAG: transglutaminase-like domain-containing protein [Lachnospiraceae bacterium]|nr:transglutaminase-like domain-containing protein [Lachnospiraceae bacterium]